MSRDLRVALEIDGRAVEVAAGTSVYDAAAALGIEIPVLCHDPRLEPAGVCRICAVEIEGERTLAASCVREAQEGMVVRTRGRRVEASRATLVDLLMAEQPPTSARQESTGDDLLFALAGEGARGGASAGGRGLDESSAVIAVNHQACILCDRCVRACADLQHHDVIGRSGKGHATRIGFDLREPMGESSCVSCGECAASCPTGALVHRAVDVPLRPRESLRPVDSVCPYCGVGCTVRYHVDDAQDRVVFCEGRESPGSRGRLCVKGRYAWDYVAHPQRLTRPLIRVDHPKRALSPEVSQAGTGRRRGRPVVDYDQVLPAFREASWEEALDLVARRFVELRDTHGGDALAGFASAKGSNEDAYLFQKLVRVGFRTNNVDHCARLCHASSVTALLEMIGSGAVTTTFGDIANADVALVTGSDTTSNHPVAATFFKDAVARGTRLIVVDPRHSPIADHAWRFCQIRSGTDVAFYHAIMNVILAEGWVDEAFVAERTHDFDAVVESVAPYTPEVAAGLCGVSAELIREVAEAYGKARAVVTYWGMGMSQHSHGTENCRAIISLCLMTGNIGRPGTGLHPLRGQNNVQGASDMGLIPMSFPDYQPVTDPEARRKFEEAWGVALSGERGLTAAEIIQAAYERRVKGMYVVGENPAMSEPNASHARDALARLDFLVVQDLFVTETAEFADVILPAAAHLEKEGSYTNTDRRVQLGRPVVSPPGEARRDWEIVADVARRMGVAMEYDSAPAVFDEFVGLSRSYRGLSHAVLGAGGKLYPCPEPEVSDGTVVMFGDRFPTPDGRARFVAAELRDAAELPCDEYPFILVTGRTLEHWHTGVMTRRARRLVDLEPTPFAELHVADGERLGIVAGQPVRVASRRGAIVLEARLGESVQPGSVFVPFHFREAAANLLTNDVLDPDSRIPEYKFCAVDVAAA